MSLFAFDEDAALSLARERQTPCFVYRPDMAEKRYSLLRAALPPRVRLAYAIKANPHEKLVERFAGLGASFDAASIGELRLLERLGVGGGRVLFAGPGKSTEELALALELGARVELDGIEDAERLDALLAQRAVKREGQDPFAVSVRVHPADGIAESSRIIGGAGPSAFGVDEEELPQFLAKARSFRHLRVVGLQMFAASNERDAHRLLENHRIALSIAARMQAELGGKLDLIDLGGGLGIPYAAGETELDVVALGTGLARLLDENAWFMGDLLLEPGRWLVGPIGVYLSRVIRTKASRGTNFAVLEGGINHLLRPLLTGQPFPVCAPGHSGNTGTVLDYTLTGPLCTSLDRLGSASLPALQPGDLMMFGQVGAYGFTEAMGTFLSHPLPEQYIVGGA